MRHCDEYIEDETAPAPLRAYLKHARSPGHGHNNPKPWPELYATYAGKRVRIVMASRFGDVGISYNLKTTAGYDLRVYVAQLADFSETP